MDEDRVVQLRQPESFEDDLLTEVLRLGARRTGECLGKERGRRPHERCRRSTLPLDFRGN